MGRDLNIVVLGSEGMLGSDLMELFEFEEGIHVRGYMHQECDITKFDDVENVLGGTQGSITHVINVVGCSDIDFCEANKDIAFRLNSTGPKNLADICQKEHIHLTHVSCDTVFEGLKKEPYLEQDETIPLTVCGKSKLEGESYVRSMGGNGLVIRTSSLYGKHGKNFIDTILNKLELAVPVKVVDDLVLCPTYTMDLANVIIQLALNKKSGLFHVVNDGSTTWYNFALKAAEYMNYNSINLIPISSTDLGKKVERPKHVILSTIRLERTLPEKLRTWQNALYQYLLETKRLYEF
jgi:dTDP-4-dehydrorhamnose reductase